MDKRSQQAVYARNVIFGVEDGLVSTVGLLSGIASAGVPRTTIVLTGLILIIVEAFSMAIGSFLSEYSAEECLARRAVSFRVSEVGGLVMFLAYVAAGAIPLAPYLFFSAGQALSISIILTLMALFGLGIWSAHIGHLNLVRSGLRMLIAGGLAVIVGVFIGGLVK